MISLIVILTMFSADMELSTGLVCPSATTCNGPAVFFEPGVVLSIAPGWDAVISMPLWKISDYDPGDSTFPDYTGGFSDWSFMYNTSYEERSVCYMAGVRRQAGFASLQLQAGMIDRDFKRKYSGPDFDMYMTPDFQSSDFTGSFSASIPAGRAGFLAAGTRYFDSEWNFTLSTGISFTGLLGGWNE